MHTGFICHSGSAAENESSPVAVSQISPVKYHMTCRYIAAECLSRIEDGLMHHDPYRTGDVPGYQITNVLRQERVPLPDDVVHNVIQW